MSIRCGGLARMALLVAALAALGGPAAVRAEDDPPTEYLGVEVGLLSGLFGQFHFHDWISDTSLQSTAVPPGQLGFRLWTMYWLLGSSAGASLSFSWSPIELVGGYLYLGENSPAWELYGGTEPGLDLRLGWARRFQIQVGLGLGGGELKDYAHRSQNGPEDGPSFSGSGLLFSPSLRVRYQTEGKMFYGLGLRALLPAMSPEPAGERLDVLNFFFELGFADREAPPEPDPEKVIERPPAPPMTWQARWGHAAFWTGLALAGFGGIATWQSWEAGQMARFDTSRSWAGGMYAGYLTGGALLVTGIVLWALSPGSEGAEVE